MKFGTDDPDLNLAVDDTREDLVLRTLDVELQNVDAFVAEFCGERR
jgi:hypothetical protein